MAVNGISSAKARSMTRLVAAGSSAAVSAACGCRGMRSDRASRFAVPRGTIPSGTPVSVSPSAHARAVPSPPTETTRSTPSSAAPWAAVVPAWAFSVTMYTARHW